jgi:alkylated DNA repair dioxygenase AlkB
MTHVVGAIRIVPPLRARAATWAGHPPDDFTGALIAQYPPGSRLGWHRDVPDFELVVGVSLVGQCRTRFRRYPPQFREKSFALDVEARSIYKLQGEARWDWQHSVPPVPLPRYSITFRTPYASKQGEVTRPIASRLWRRTSSDAQVTAAKASS